MRVRKAKPEDLGRIIGLHWEMEAFHTKFDRKFYAKESRASHLRMARKHFAKLMVAPRVILLVAEERGMIVGYLHGSVVDRPPIYRLKKQGVIDELAVSRAFRRRGAAARLLEAAHRELRGRGAAMTLLDVDAKNAGARRFYSKSGYRCRHLRLVKHPAR